MSPHDQKSTASGQATQSKDPVCGMMVEADTPHKMEYGGTTYLFCHASCLEKFRKNPAQFIG